MESDYRWLVTVGLVTSSVIAVTANAFLLLVFAKRRTLRNVPHRFIYNLLVTNLLSSLLLIPLLLVDQKTSPNSLNAFLDNNQSTIQQIEEDVVFQEELVSGNPNVKIIETSEKFLTEEKLIKNLTNDGGSQNEKLLCYFAQASTNFVCTASILSILLIGINQYFGVIHSLRYHFYINKGRATILITCSWLVALVCGFLSMLTYSDGSLWYFCARKGVEIPAIRTLNTVYAFSYFILVILAPFIAICIIYLCIYSAAHESSERMRKSTSAASNAPLDTIHVEILERSSSPGARSQSLPKVHSAPNFSALDQERIVISYAKTAKVKRTSSDRNNIFTKVRHKFSNASVFRYREETRAAKISAIVIFTVFVCYVPYGITLVLTSACIRVNPGEIFNYLSLVLLVFSNVISPFLFGYRNKRVKKEIGRMFGCIPPSSEIYNSETFKRQTNITRNRSFEGIHETVENSEPLLKSSLVVPEVIVTCKVENEKKSILKRVGSGWTNYKKCNFITVPDGCLGDARGSFSSASTQLSNDD